MIPITNQKKDFIFPLKFDSLEDSLYKSSTNYLVQVSEATIAGMNNDTMMSQLSLFNQNISKDYSFIKRQHTFDLLYGFIRGFSRKLTFRPIKLFEEILSNLDNWIRIIIKKADKIGKQTDLFELRNSLKMVLFLGFYAVKTSLQAKQFETTTEKLEELANNKKKKKNVVNPDLTDAAKDKQYALILTIVRSLKVIDLTTIWQNQTIEELFFTQYYNIGIQLIMSPLSTDRGLRKDITDMFNRILIYKQSLLKVIKKTIVSAMTLNEMQCQKFCQYFHSCPPQNSLTQEVIKQTLVFIKNNPNNSQNAKLKNLSLFLNSVCDKFSQLFLSNFANFINLYDSQCHQLRNNMTSIIQSIIKSLAEEQDQKSIQVKQKLISILLQRVYDKTVFARSHVLNSLEEMVKDKLLSRKILKLVYQMAFDRLKDTGANPRKRAIILVHSCTERFIQLFRNEDRIKFRSIADIKLLLVNTLEDLQKNQAEFMSIKEQLKNEQDHEILSEQFSRFERRKNHLERKIAQYDYNLEIFKIIQSGLPILKCLLNSTYHSDVAETIKLIMLLKSVEVENIEPVLECIWKKAFADDPAIQNQVIQCFIALHKIQSNFNVEAIITIFTNPDPKKIQCFQNIMKNIIEDKGIKYQQFKDDFVNVMWERFKYSISNQIQNKNPSSVAEKQALMSILQTIFMYRPNSITTPRVIYGVSYIQHYLKQPKSIPSAQIIIFFTHMIQYARNNVSLQARQHFLLMTVPLVYSNKSFPVHVWCEVLRTLIEVASVACTHPEKLLKSILIKLIEASDKQKQNYKKTKANKQEIIDSLLRVHFFFGELFVKLTDIFSNLSQTTERIIKKGITSIKKAGDQTLSKTNKQQERNTIMDKITEDVQNIQYQGNDISKEIKYKSSSLMQSDYFKNWASQTVEIVQKLIKKGSDGSAFQKIAVINFGKLITSSLSFAKQHAVELRLLMTRCQDESIRINSIIIFADALSQNSSALSPHIEGLFQCVLDNTKRVQITALNAIWYLVDSDTLLFESNLSYIAVVFEDQTSEIKQLAKKFLFKKNKKDQNFLLRKLPETVKQLSDADKLYGQKTITDKTFECYSKEILHEIGKSKGQAAVESVTASLIDMLKTSITVTLTKNCCLAISILHHNEKSLVLLVDGYRYFGGKLRDGAFDEYFADLVNRMRRHQKGEAKGNIKSLLDQIETMYVNHNTENRYIRPAKANTKQQKQQGKQQNRPNEKNKKAVVTKRQRKEPRKKGAASVSSENQMSGEGSNYDGSRRARLQSVDSSRSERDAEDIRSQGENRRAKTTTRRGTRNVRKLNLAESSNEDDE